MNANQSSGTEPGWVGFSLATDKEPTHRERSLPGDENRETRRGVGMTTETAEVLVSSSEIQEKVREIGRRITEDYRREKLLLVGVVLGRWFP